MKRISTKIGDVFSVEIDENNNKYFQLVAFDLTQLNSDVIRAFRNFYPTGISPVLSEIVNGEVDFYAHCVTKFGLKMNLWDKIGNISEIGDVNNILFRGTKDYGLKVDDELIRTTDNWYIWRINDEKFTRVGELQGKNKEAEIGLIVNPYDIVERIKTGKYSFFYPEYE